MCIIINMNMRTEKQELKEKPQKPCGLFSVRKVV